MNRHTMWSVPLAVTVLMVGMSSAWAQVNTVQPTRPPAPPPGHYNLYLANFSIGRALFIIGPHRQIFLPWRVREGEDVACDLPSKSFFAPTTLFPQNACRITVDVTHDLWIRAMVFYPSTVCFDPNNPNTCYRTASAAATVHRHLVGLREGATYELDACGEQGAQQANCGWREITWQDKSY